MIFKSPPPTVAAVAVKLEVPKLDNPVMVPPVIDTLLLSCSARVPSLIASTTLEPSLYTKFVLPAPTVIPVPVEFLTTMLLVQLLLIDTVFVM